MHFNKVQYITRTKALQIVEELKKGKTLKTIALEFGLHAGQMSQNLKGYGHDPMAIRTAARRRIKEINKANARKRASFKRVFG